MLFLAQDIELSADWGNEQNVHPLGLAMLLLTGMALLLVRRRYAMVPLIVIALMVTTAQRVVVAGLDFPFLRILILLGLMRVFMMGEGRKFKMIALDWAILVWATSFFLANVAREGNVVFCCGWLVDNVGAYFLFRCLMRTRQEVFQFAKWVAILTFPVALAFVFEKFTKYNLFSVFGGVREITWVRDGKLRCMGPFQHPILAGCVFSGMFPILAIAWRGTAESRPVRGIAAAGMISAVTITVCCASSTPLVSLAAGIGAMCLWRHRKFVPTLRWATVFMLFALHMVMKKPVWHLISRVDLIGGSTGYHRYRLIDAAIRHTSEWFVMGVRSTEHWGPHLFDVTSHLVLQATEGGMATFLSFLMVLTFAFRAVRRVIQRTPDVRDHFTAWMFGSALFANCVSFIGVSFFGRPLLFLMFQMAVLGSLEVAASRSSVRARAPRRLLHQQPGHGAELGAAN